MWMWLDRVGLILFDAALSTGLFLSLVVLAMLVCRQPSRRLLLVRSSLLASLAIIPVVAVLPLPRVDVLDLILRADFLPPSSPAIELDGQSRPSSGQNGVGGRVRSHIAIFKGDYAAWAGRWLPRSLTLIVLTVAVTGAAWVLLGFWGVRWLLRHSREPSPSTQAIYATVSALWTEKRARPDVLVSSAVQRPVLVGLRRTTILIPASYEAPEASDEICKLSLLHELAHAGQSDPWFGTVASLAQSIWFFLPHVWWLRSQLMIDQEFMADHAASRGYGTAKDYAASLLSLADSRPASTALERSLRRDRSVRSSDERRMRSPLYQRMLMLLHCPFPVERKLPRRWSWSLRLVVFVASFASACLCVRWPHAWAIEQARSGAAKGEREPFRVADFVAAPVVHTSSGRGLPHHMPVSLSARFDLRVEVLAGANELEKIQIAGHSLISDPSLQRVIDPLSNPSFHAVSWHHVRLRREGPELALWIDGSRSAAILDPDATTEWLTFDPAERFVSFRNLVVDW
jgi:BlaR1 peptidase M56